MNSIGFLIKEDDWMYEDELPENLPDYLYDWWFNRSIVDGVRIGPVIKEVKDET